MNIADIEKQLKKNIDLEGEISSLSGLRKIETIPFGIPSLDALTGRGGVPRGLITEIFGNPSSGKTSLTLEVVAQAQAKGIKCCYIDLEFALTEEIAKRAGVDTDKLVVVRPATGEEAFEVIENMVEEGFGLVILDSVASISAESELEADYEQQTIGLQARLVSKAMRKLVGLLYRKNAALVFINQIRAKMATMPGAKTTTTSGGMAIPFYASLRLEVTSIGRVKDGDEIIGMELKVWSAKNKLYRPFLETRFQFLFETGINKGLDLLTHLVKIGEVREVGRTYYWGEKAIGTKTDAAKYLLDNYKTVDKSTVDKN